MDACMFHYKNCGYTLLEVMMSIGLSITIMALVLPQYLIFNQQFLWIHDQLTIQKKAERLMILLRDQIHLAGYLGCTKLTNEFPLLNGKDLLNVDNRLQVTSQNHLIIRGMTDAVTLLNDGKIGSKTLTVSYTKNLKPHVKMIITDCLHGEIIEAQSLKHHKEKLIIMLNQPLQSHYAAGASLGLLRIEDFYLALNHKSESSLFMRESDGVTRELIPGVDSWTFHLSEKYQNQHYNQTPNHVKAWRQVDGITIDFTLKINTLMRMWHLYVALI
jgi:type II secretory pathway pseudopilin PulG